MFLFFTTLVWALKKVNKKLKESKSRTRNEGIQVCCWRKAPSATWWAFGDSCAERLCPCQLGHLLRSRGRGLQRNQASRCFVRCPSSRCLFVQTKQQQQQQQQLTHLTPLGFFSLEFLIRIISLLFFRSSLKRYFVLSCWYPQKFPSPSLGVAFVSHRIWF